MARPPARIDRLRTRRPLRETLERGCAFVPQAADGTAYGDEAGVHALASARFERDGACSLPYAQQADLLPVSQRVSLKVGSDVVLSTCLANLRAGGGGMG